MTRHSIIVSYPPPKHQIDVWEGELTLFEIITFFIYSFAIYDLTIVTTPSPNLKYLSPPVCTRAFQLTLAVSTCYTYSLVIDNSFYGFFWLLGAWHLVFVLSLSKNLLFKLWGLSPHYSLIRTSYFVD
jgi:hypothetical protein